MNKIQTLSSSIELINENDIKISGLSNINENQEIHYLVYKIINVINGKYYIGLHLTYNPYDDYMGSGLLLDKAKNKYGIDNFIKFILFDFNNKIEMNYKEAELMPEISCHQYNLLCYNISPGGQGGNLGTDSIEKTKLTWKNKSIIEINKIVEKRLRTLNNKSAEEKLASKQKEIETKNKNKNKIRKALINAWKNKTKQEINNATNKRLITIANKSIEEKEKIKQKRSLSHKKIAKYGKDHPLYGSKFMRLPGKYDKCKRIFVKPRDFEKYLKLGYIFCDTNFKYVI